MGETSAFFTYVKSNMLKIGSLLVPPSFGNKHQCSTTQDKLDTLTKEVNFHSHGNEEAAEIQYQVDEFASSNITPDSISVKRSYNSPPSPELSHQTNMGESSDFNPHASYPYFMMNQYMIPLMHQTTSPYMLPQYNQYTHCPQVALFPYYPIRVCLPPAQIIPEQPWPSSHGSSSSTDGNSSKFDRREAALLKFRQKRKSLCFDKKVRHFNRKKLAEKRPQAQGQFVRKVNEADYDNDDNDEDDYEDDELAARNSSPMDD